VNVSHGISGDPIATRRESMKQEMNVKKASGDADPRSPGRPAGVP